MSGDPAITTLIIAATYTAIVGYSAASQVMTISPFNPASALGIAAAQLFQGNIDETRQVWVFFIFSYVGSLLACLLFEFVYKKAIINADRDGNDEVLDEDDDTAHDSLITPTSQ